MKQILITVLMFMLLIAPATAVVTGVNTDYNYRTIFGIFNISQIQGTVATFSNVTATKFFGDGSSLTGVTVDNETLLNLTGDYFYNKIESDARYLQSYTETDPVFVANRTSIWEAINLRLISTEAASLYKTIIASDADNSTQASQIASLTNIESANNATQSAQITGLSNIITADNSTQSNQISSVNSSLWSQVNLKPNITDVQIALNLKSNQSSLLDVNSTLKSQIDTKANQSSLLDVNSTLKSQIDTKANQSSLTQYLLRTDANSTYAALGDSDTITGNWIFAPASNVSFSTGRTLFYNPVFFFNNVTLTNSSQMTVNGSFLLKNIGGGIITNISEDPVTTKVKAYFDGNVTASWFSGSINASNVQNSPWALQSTALFINTTLWNQNNLQANLTNLASVNSSLWSEVNLKANITNVQTALDLKANQSSLLSVNTTAVGKASPANCPAGEVVQNTTTTGVQCTVAASTGFTYSTWFNQYLNTTSNVTFNKVVVSTNITVPKVCLNTACTSYIIAS